MGALLPRLIETVICVFDIGRSVSEPDVLPIKAALLFSIKGYSEVTDAEVAVHGHTISLILEVRLSTNEVRARELGENFVRMTKSLLQDGTVGLLPGRGIYSYLVTVGHSRGAIMAHGAKHWRSDHIRWLGG